MTTIEIAAAVLLNRRGEMLVVRKRGFGQFMQPGGKLDLGETPYQALRRELQEEIGLSRHKELDFVPCGMFRAPAANEDGATVAAHVFRGRFDGPIACGGEIETALWLDMSGEVHLPLAALTRDFMLPLARQATGQLQGCA